MLFIDRIHNLPIFGDVFNIFIPFVMNKLSSSISLIKLLTIFPIIHIFKLTYLSFLYSLHLHCYQSAFQWLIPWICAYEKWGDFYLKWGFYPSNCKSQRNICHLGQEELTHRFLAKRQCLLKAMKKKLSLLVCVWQLIYIFLFSSPQKPQTRIVCC